MKQSILLFSCLIFFCLTGCQKAAQIHLISAHTWVVTEISAGSNFAQVGDELIFYDNRLYFKNSNGIETDGKWDFSGETVSPFIPASADRVSVTSGFGAYDFSIINLTNTALELDDSFINVRLKPKE